MRFLRRYPHSRSSARGKGVYNVGADLVLCQVFQQFHTQLHPRSPQAAEDLQYGSGCYWRVQCQAWTHGRLGGRRASTEGDEGCRRVNLAAQ